MDVRASARALVYFLLGIFFSFFFSRDITRVSRRYIIAVNRVCVRGPLLYYTHTHTHTRARERGEKISFSIFLKETLHKTLFRN